MDTEFLKEIEGWRDALARNIALRNPRLTDRELNFAVQATIDRLIFLRMCEDRGIEPYGRLQALCGGPRIYPRLVQIYREADERYNSGLFHFEPEQDRARLPDELTPRLEIDDKVLKGILSGLYYPESPYEFRILPPEILGNVYEQFLGKVIRLTAGHQAKIEEKPEVRKAGGVYYTPSYIVDYIVKNTVGRLLGDTSSTKDNKAGAAAPVPNAGEEAPRSPAVAAGVDRGSSTQKTLTPAEASRLRILDPACGSGSFLLGAYQYLLDWHLKVYLAEKEKTGKIPTIPPEAGQRRRKTDLPVMYQGQGGDYLLTTLEKKRILLNNIYGVDIDPQAVEVTKLSLLLKVLENENQDSLRSQLTLWRERALPDLSANIKCGNSLIGPNFYRDQHLPLLGEDDKYRINAFDWTDDNQGFGDILRSGGFDAIIGNPPYIRIQAMKEWAPIEVELYKKLYKSAAAGNYDIYVVFVEKALSLLNWKGRMGFILPHKFFNAKYGEALRGIISEGRHLAHVVHFGDQQVFSGATTYTCLLFLDKAGASDCHFVKVADLDSWKGDATPSSRSLSSGSESVSTTAGQISAKTITASEWNFAVGAGAATLRRVHDISTKLGDVAHIFQGLVTGADKVFVVTPSTDIEKGLARPFLLTGDLTAYTSPVPSAKIIFPYDIKDAKAELTSADTLKKNYPKGWAYLTKRREELMNRERGKWRHERWYAFGRSQNLTQMETAKLIIQVTAQRPTVLFDDQGLYMTGGGSGPFYGIRPKDPAFSIKYLLGIMNSALFGWIVKAQSTYLRGGYIKFSKQYIETVPIVPLEQAGPSKVNALITIVEETIRLHKKLPGAKTPDEKTRLEREIAATDKQIDALVYELYGLTEDEIRIVEGAK